MVMVKDIGLNDGFWFNFWLWLKYLFDMVIVKNISLTYGYS